MEEIARKLSVLTTIAKELNTRHIVWAVGASLLLYFKNRVPDFHDIDIMVSEADVEEVKNILLRHGSLQPPNPNARYKTKHFMEFSIEGVDVDVMAGFVIVNNDREYYFPLQAQNIKDYVTIGDTEIPLQSLSEWREYYLLMGRTEKVKIIDSFV